MFKLGKGNLPFCVRQSEYLPPLSFAIFINDYDMFEFIYHAYQGLDLLEECTSQMLGHDDIEV